MPELPEVETIARLLRPHVEGQLITGVEFSLPRLVLGRDKNLSGFLVHKTLLRILRRGKYLILEFNEGALIVHLGMTGQLTYSPPQALENPNFRRTVTGLQKAIGVHPVDKHTHLVIHLHTGARILFRDPRTFGKLIPIPSGDWVLHPRVLKLGLEPLESPLARLLNAYPFESTRSIKAVLLDQTFLSGVGNIYADEALFSAGIHPLKKARSLKPVAIKNLMLSVKSALRKGIRHQGTTFSDYRKPDGSLGSNQERLMAYGRGGEPCRRCDTPMTKMVVAGRGTVFCSQCQPLK